jgi:hypothetical protein
MSSSSPTTITYQVGEHVSYVKNDKRQDATIAAIHRDDEELFYTIIGKFGEKQTISRYLLPLEPSAAKREECDRNPETLFDIELVGFTIFPLSDLILRSDGQRWTQFPLATKVFGSHPQLFHRL